MNPEKLNKYLYIEKTPTWLVRGMYAISIIAWALLLLGFSGSVIYIPFYRYFVGPALVFFSAYYFLSYGLNMFYKQFDLPKHKALIKTYWGGGIKSEPSVDIFLPICGEDIALLKNTWENVARLNYANKKVYVLDDSRDGCGENKLVAESYGFTYFERPDKGWMKKAGNLRYAHERTEGEFIVIFDADFAPHKDFLREVLPYMDNAKVGIVQTPQYFETTSSVHKRSPLEYGASHVQEAFYRYIQVSRSRFGGTICCGSNAIYRRSALDKIGGTVLIDHSEDAYTGFELTAKGYQVLYVPVILAIGVCPSDVHAYFHQQHRWSTGSLSLFLSKRFWKAPVSWKTKLCYSVGFLFYLHYPLAIIFSFQLFWTLFFYNDYISLSNGTLFYPAMFWGFIILFTFSISRFRSGFFLAMLIQTYAYSHAVFSAFLKSSVGWIPTNTRQQGVSVAFNQATIAVGVYLATYLGLVALALRNNMLQLFNYDYYGLQFWIFYNCVLSGTLLWHMYQTIEQSRQKMVLEGISSHREFTIWRMKTGGLYIGLLTSMFLGIVFT